MEEGSLLQEVLRKRSRGDFGPNESDSSKSTIVFDVHSLKTDLNHRAKLLFLANLARECNHFVQSQTYQWHHGGDGPVFGIHVDESEDIPHLRAYCVYGPSVQDEWACIDFMLQMSQQLDHDIAISCWDLGDGQVILIQTADMLPDWLDEDPSDDHRFACWIRNGQIQLLKKPHVSLGEALSLLQQNDNQNSSHPKIQETLEKWLTFNQRANKLQRTALVVPRKIAALIQKRPDLVNAAIQSFCENIEEQVPSILHHEDWVWITHSISRTNYAMARTMVSKVWKTTDQLPKIPMEVKRYKRQCEMEATPHLKYAIQLGVRLVIGVDLLLQNKISPSSTEQRIAFWSRIDQACHDSDQSSWLVESYQQGPNHSAYDLTNILKCPVFPEERKFMTLYSYPETSLKQQIIDVEKGVDYDKDFPMPTQEEVDDEAWLDLDGEDGKGEHDLDSILSSFQNFMVHPSGVEGVESSPAVEAQNPIRPRIFMNILQSVLKGENLSFPTSDPFFYHEDYDLMDTEAEEDESAQAMRGLMDAMDAELNGKSESRKLDDFAKTDENAEVTENAHILNNILQSLEASEGRPGPVNNMLKEMTSSSHS